MVTHTEQQPNQFSQQQKSAGQKPTSTRGFAAMDAEKHRKVSAEGGRASQQQQHNARKTQAHPTDSTTKMTENFSQQNKQESSTESASSSRTGSNQSTGLASSVNPNKDH